MTIQDRPYQVEARDAVFDRWRGEGGRTLLVLPTGTGKTVVAGMIARRAKDELGLKTLFLAHREELILQAVAKLQRLDLVCAVEMADQHARDGLMGPCTDVVVGTVQSMQASRLESWPREEFGVIIIDEAHHARAQTYRNILGWFEGYWLLGITATPDRGDGKNLGAVFDSLATEYTLARAIREGYLVPLRTAQLRTDVDLRAMGMRGRDYTDEELAELISPHIEGLADAFSRECGGRPSVLFTPNVRTAEGMAEALVSRGVMAEAVSGKMPRADRRAALGRFHRGEYQAVVCCDLLTEGWDEPHVACVGVCRPTRMRSRYAQMIGRGTRPHPESGKADCLVIDFAWQTTANHKLMTPIDLFADSRLDDEVAAEARKLLDRGRGGDPQEALDRAAQTIAWRREFHVLLSGRAANYRKIIFDPVGVGELIGVPIREGRDPHPARPATPPQLDHLGRLGVKAPAGLGKSSASRLIDALHDRRARNLATVKQMNFLVDLGADPDVVPTLDFTAASLMIDDLRRNGR